ncbi:conserved hypothetical protein [Trichinella spiralis]|uniref:hypothetical protein n=1 Tax=Trichinella spiralis TaxID=6334 RepID=UPI0001EFCD4F|nr:conserved hypothetical protein [Trichinella spiralis]
MFCNLKHVGSVRALRYHHVHISSILLHWKCAERYRWFGSHSSKLFGSYRDSKDSVVETHSRKLLDATPCNDASLETSRKLYDKVDLHIRALETLRKNHSSPELTASEFLLEIFKDMKLLSRGEKLIFFPNLRKHQTWKLSCNFFYMKE